MRQCALAVIDLLGLLVAQQEQDGAKQEDGRAPAHTIRPAELPQLPVALLDLSRKACRVDHQRDQDAQQRADHDVEGEPVHEVLAHGVLAAQAASGHDGGGDVTEERDDAEGGRRLDVGDGSRHVAAGLDVQAEGQRERRVLLHALLPETLAELVRYEPVGRGQAQDHQQDHDQAADEGKHLQRPDDCDRLNRCRRHCGGLTLLV